MIESRQQKRRTKVVHLQFLSKLWLTEKIKHKAYWYLVVFLLSVICYLSPVTWSHATSDLPIPRFVSLKAKTANLRVGPGTDYPILWVLTKRGYPLEIVAEFDHWRKVRDWEGTEGWVHKALLSGQRNVLVKGYDAVVYRYPQSQTKIVAYLEQRVIAELIECQKDWCRINVMGRRGWIKRDQLWGVDQRRTAE